MSAAAKHATCASCQHIGIAYWDNGFTISHHCMKGDERRAEEMPRSADFLAHFRAFFDAHADQKACRFYEERPPAAEDVRALLQAINEGDCALKFWTDESRLAESLSSKFVQQDYYAEAPRGYRVFKLLPVGRAELARATTGGSHE